MKPLITRDDKDICEDFLSMDLKEGETYKVPWFTDDNGDWHYHTFEVVKIMPSLTRVYVKRIGTIAAPYVVDKDYLSPHDHIEMI